MTPNRNFLFCLLAVPLFTSCGWPHGMPFVPVYERADSAAREAEERASAERAGFIYDSNAKRYKCVNYASFCMDPRLPNVWLKEFEYRADLLTQVAGMVVHKDGKIEHLGFRSSTGKIELLPAKTRYLGFDTHWLRINYACNGEYEIASYDNLHCGKYTVTDNELTLVSKRAHEETKYRSNKLGNAAVSPIQINTVLTLDDHPFELDEVHVRPSGYGVLKEKGNLVRLKLQFYSKKHVLVLFVSGEKDGEGFLQMSNTIHWGELRLPPSGDYISSYTIRRDGTDKSTIQIYEIDTQTRRVRGNLDMLVVQEGGAQFKKTIKGSFDVPMFYKE